MGGGFLVKDVRDGSYSLSISTCKLRFLFRSSKKYGLHYSFPPRLKKNTHPADPFLFGLSRGEVLGCGGPYCSEPFMMRVAVWASVTRRRAQAWTSAGVMELTTS